MANQYAKVNAVDPTQEYWLPITDGEQMSRALVYIFNLKFIKIKNVFFSLINFTATVLRTLPWVITWSKNNLLK